MVLEGGGEVVELLVRAGGVSGGILGGRRAGEGRRGGEERGRGWRTLIVVMGVVVFFLLLLLLARVRRMASRKFVRMLGRCIVQSERVGTF